MMTAEIIEAAVVHACLTELEAVKPGNVHRLAPGHGMTVADFTASALAAAPWIARAGLGIGERIFRAVRATSDAVGQNTNLGIALLATPLAAAAEAGGSRPLRARLAEVLAALDVADTEWCFRAIALADPGGLGRAGDHDVRRPARIGLREAMGLAADRDRIARQYVTVYEDVFTLGLPVLDAAGAPAAGEVRAAERIYLRYLSAFPDSHVTRKFGAAAAEDVRQRAVAVRDALGRGQSEAAKTALLMGFDAELKARAINPGTSADLTVATLLAKALVKGCKT